MCVLAFAWDAHPRWRLLLIGNRDEYHGRPAAPLARWDDPGELIGGRDLLSGGTWLGISEQGRMAVVTNVRGYGGPAPDRPSRGALVTGLLQGDDPDTVPLGDYNPVNLVLADRGGLRFLSNRPDVRRASLDSGLYGLSNGQLDEPWPKTLRIKAFLLAWLTGDARTPATLLDDLADETLDDHGLNPASPSDVPQEPWETPIFIRNPVYGTRCSSVVAIDRDGEGRFWERRYDADGEATGDTHLSFRWPY